MQRRLLIVYLTLTAVILLATEIPLGLNLAMNNYHHLVIRQVSNAFSLASAAEATGGAAPDAAWKARAKAYSEKNDAVVLLFDDQGRRTYSTRPGTKISDPEWRRTLLGALVGESTVPLDYSFNISARPLFVAEPVLKRGRPVGSVATISPTTSLRSQVTQDALLLLGVAVAGLLAAAAVGIPLVRWSLRPARQLQAAVRQIAQGQYSVRATADRGPPELRELAEAVNGMTDRLVSVLEAQRCFVADASHQMRNPLTALRVRVEALEAVVPEDGQENLAVAVAEADRLSRILDELLVLANAATVDGGSSTIDVRAVVESRARALSSRAEEADVTIAVQGRGAPARCLPGALDQVLDVLLDNALGFSPPGGRVTVRIRSDDTSVYVEVEDQGPGMSPQEKERATDRFWRGRQPGRRSGSGLGLAIAKALLKAGGAELELDDAEPRGLLARAVLPRVVPATALPGRDRRAVSPDGPAGERKPARQGDAGGGGGETGG
ncbi:HAMP domain-containing sensor histidine kinase [Streptomyces sp. NPDC005799]|uniref:sensor histidine kinase n=1 Tax=Streptomyces sp. NPDC005799 TaxID=3154678 RepID=UPI0033C07FCB